MADLNARIKPKKSSTTGEVPQAADLEVAEIAVNTADGKLFVKHTDDSIKEISGGTDITTESIDALSDVDTSTTAPTDGQVLTWDNVNSQWEPADAAGAVDSVNGQTGAVALDLGDLGDVKPTFQRSVWTTRNTGTNISCGGSDAHWNIETPGGWPQTQLSIVDSNGNDLTSVFNTLLPDAGDVVKFYDPSDDTLIATITLDSASAPQYGFCRYDLLYNVGGDPEYDKLVAYAGTSIYVSVNDVVIGISVPVTDGQVLTWVDANSQWEPADAAGGGGALELGDLDDVESPVAGYPGGLVLLAEGQNFVTVPDNLDVSPYGRTQSGAANKPAYSTNQAKYGTSSILFNGSSQGLYFPNNTDGLTGSLLTNDFTVEGWFRFVSFFVFNTIFQDANYYNNDYTCGLSTVANNPNQFRLVTSTLGNNAVEHTITGGFSLLTGTWYHIALCRSGNNFRLFVDGTQYGSTVTSVTEPLFNNTASHKVGISRNFENVEVAFLGGYMEDYRVTQSALYTTNFTPAQITLQPPVADGQVLTWVAANDQWEAADTSNVVDSVNGQTGVVALDLADLGDVADGSPIATTQTWRGTWTVSTVTQNQIMASDGDMGPATSNEINFYRLDADGVDFSTTLANANGTTIYWKKNSEAWQSETMTSYRSFSVDTLIPTAAALSASVNAAQLGDTYVIADDVDAGFTPPTDGQVLTWVNANSRWEPAELDGTAVRAALGIGEYADDAAADTGGVASGAMYYNTTSSDYRLKT